MFHLRRSSLCVPRMTGVRHWVFALFRQSEFCFRLSLLFRCCKFCHYTLSFAKYLARNVPLSFHKCDRDSTDAATQPREAVEDQLGLKMESRKVTVERSGTPLVLLPVSAGGLVTVHVMHRLTVKFLTVFRCSVAAGGQRTAVAFAKVVTVIDVTVKMFRPVEPGSSPDEETSGKPLRPIITIRSAVVRRDLVVPVRANRRRPDLNANPNLGLCFRSHARQTDSNNSS
jgi:hypothetical protein